MKRTLAYIFTAVMGITLLISLNAAQRRSAAAELMLTETTKAAVAEAAAELEALTLSLEKLLLTTSPGSRPSCCHRSFWRRTVHS